MIALIGLVVGIIIGIVVNPTLPPGLQPYLPIMIVAALDAIFGAVRAYLAPVSYTHLTLPTIYSV